MTRRKAMTTVLAVVTMLVAGLLTAALNPQPAAAHGAMMKPGSRTFLCWKDGRTEQGNIVPKNSACAAAVAQSGDNSLYNWFSVLRSDGAGRTEGFIPDGKLCSGGNPNFSGFDLAGNWPVTHLTAGASFTFSYNAWAAHPGWFYLYITKDGYDPSRPLRWDDLEDQPFLTADHPAVTGQVGSENGQYLWTGNFPTGKSGKHVIYSVWKRSDSTETFYGCSDVVFDGGNGEVTGVGEVDDPGEDPGTPPTGDCTAQYNVTSSWNGGYQADVVVTNGGSTPLSGWTVTWTLPSGQTLNSVWNGTLSQSGSAVTVRNASWNAQVPANGQTSFGLSASSPGTSPAQPVDLACTSG